MAEPYSDEELAAWLAVYPPVISSLDARWRPTIVRLLAERDEARAGLLHAAQLAEEAVEAGQKLLAQRDEARSDAFHCATLVTFTPRQQPNAMIVARALLYGAPAEVPHG